MLKPTRVLTLCLLASAFPGGAFAAVPAGALSSRTLGNPPAQPAPAQPSPPPASAVVQQPATTSGVLRTNPGAAAKAPTANLAAFTAVTGSKQSKYTPGRTQTLQSQAALRTSEEAAALTARQLAAAGTPAQTNGSGSASALARQTSAASASGLGARRPSLAMKTSVSPGVTKLSEGIWSVNNKERDFVMTPGAHVTIAGYHLGETLGQVFLFPSVQGQRLAFQVIDWHDGEIYALLPAGTRGIPDQAAKLQVITRDGRTFLLDGQFYATREEIFLTTHLDQVIELQTESSWAASITNEGDVIRAGATCAPPGTDRLYFKPLPGGFEVSGISAWFGRTDTGDSDVQGHKGSRTFAPGYALGEWTTGSLTQSRLKSVKVDVMPVSWGVWRSHTDGSMGYFGAPDACASSYRVNVNLVGPAGVAPSF